jgi:hypothetical protein
MEYDKEVPEQKSGTVFTTLHFFRDLQMGLLSWSVCPGQDFPAEPNVLGHD